MFQTCYFIIVFCCLDCFPGNWCKNNVSLA